MQGDLLRLLDLETDGTLDAEEARTLAAARSRVDATSGEAMAIERRRLAALHDLLVADRVPVRPGFAGAVMAALPAPAWARPRRNAWRLPAAVLAALFVVAALLVGLDAERLAGASPAYGVLGAVGAFAVASALSGAGLLGASWQALATVVGEGLGATEWIVLAGGVLALDLLVLRLLLRRRARTAEAAAPTRRS